MLSSTSVATALHAASDASKREEVDEADTVLDGADRGDGEGSGRRAALIFLALGVKALPSGISKREEVDEPDTVLDRMNFGGGDGSGRRASALRLSASVVLTLGTASDASKREEVDEAVGRGTASDEIEIGDGDGSG